MRGVDLHDCSGPLGDGSRRKSRVSSLCCLWALAGRTAAVAVDGGNTVAAAAVLAPSTASW